MKTRTDDKWHTDLFFLTILFQNLFNLKTCIKATNEEGKEKRKNKQKLQW